MSWMPEAGGYRLWFNRDELDSRAAESPPQFRERDGVRYVAPRDAQAGGTWLLLTEHGVTLAVLNHYPAGEIRAAPAGRSRGELPERFVGVRRTDDIAAVALERDVRGALAPFHLVVIDSDAKGRCFTWDGEVLISADLPTLLTSSSFDSRAVEGRRRERYEQLRPTTRMQRTRFHADHDSADGAGSICMRRPDARTRSICVVTVQPGLRSLEYRTVAWNPLPDGAESVTCRL